MAETIKIGGELESTATGNVVAAASAIKDKVKNKYQGEINAETDATLTNHASAIQGLNSQNYASYAATDQTTAVTDVLPATGSTDTIYRVGNWDGSQFDETCYSEYAWNGSAYVHIDTKTQIGEVFDISAYHATGSTLATYDNLAAALDSNNGGGVPVNLRKGGMSVKFVCNSDNKYVQFRYMLEYENTTAGNAAFVETDNWSFCGDDVLIECSEYINVFTDKDGRILWAIRKEDGKIFYGAGVPQQIVDYINTIISNLDLDKVISILAFIGELLNGTYTLEELLNEKEEYIENPEFSYVLADVEGRMIETIGKDGVVKLYKELEVLRLTLEKLETKEVEYDSCTQNSLDSQEWVYLLLDKDERIIEGTRKDGEHIYGKFPSQIKKEINKIVEEKTEEIENDIEETIDSRLARTRILDLFSYKEVKPILQNYKLADYQYGGSYQFDHKNLTFLVFSDIHGNATNMSRISDFYEEYSSYIDNVISCGDNVDSNWGDDFTFWANNGGSSFLNVIGNHEPVGTQQYGYTIVSPKACYDRYFAPFIDSWGVIKVTDKCYWYKDYVDAKSAECPGGIRMICIDLYHWKENLYTKDEPPVQVYEYPDGVPVDTGQQEAWFVNVLADARTNGMAVIVALHAPHYHVTKIDCTFDTLDSRAVDTINGFKDDLAQNVQDFIDAGGHFITYLTGHTHQDFFVKVRDFPDQIISCVNTASYTKMWRSYIKSANTNAMDDFNIVSIEPKKKYIRLYKIGGKYDRHGRHIGSLVYKYDTHELIYND